MENFKMFNISGKREYKLEDLFEVMYDEDENFFAVSKDTFEHNEPESNLVFNYKYAIEAVYCEGNIFYQLALVPLPESLSKKKFNDVVECCGCNPEDVDTYDVFSYGLGILMGSTMTNGETIDEDTLEQIANTMPTINGLKGFYLDNFQNRIGSTGWDYLQDYINGVDATKVALDRYNVN